MLSKNNRWDILEDKNLLVKVGNGIIAKEDLGFSEDGSVIPNRRDVLEGKPYETLILKMLISLRKKLKY